MRNHRRFIAALAMLASALSAQAYVPDSDGKIIVTCQAGYTPHLADVSRAIEHSRYWASHNARRQMVLLARESCASGSKAVNFVPPPDQR